MITIMVLLVVGVLLGAIAAQLARRGRRPPGSPALADLRRALEAMERDYRLRVATEELSRQTPGLDALPGLDRPARHLGSGHGSSPG